MRLGRPKRALQVYETALPTLPSVYRRDRGVALANFSAACVGADEPERAATIGRQALAIARSSGSARTERAVAQVGRRLAEHSDLVPVSALLDELSVGVSG